MYYIIRLLIEAAVAAALFGVALTIFCAARRMMLRGVPTTDEAELFTIIAATGSADALEQTVNCLLRGDTPRIIITDCGLEDCAKKLASLIARDSARVTVCSPRELPLVLEENGWTQGGIISS